MKTAIYVPIPHVTGHSPRLAAADAAAQASLAPGEVDPGFTLALESTLEAERLGFDLALFAERHLGPDLEAWVLAAAVASHTERIRIMPASNPDYWHPNMLAKLAATLDRIAPGRSAINFVTGWNADEATYFSSVRHESDEAKYSRAEAFIETMRATWDAAIDTPVTPPADGAEFAPAALPLVPAAAHPPLYTVSRSDRGLEMVARCADHWFVDWGRGQRPFDEVLATARESIDALHERTDRTGREVGLCLSAFVLPAESEEAGRARIAELTADTAARSPHLLQAQLGALGAGLVGPAELIRERLAAFAELGIDLVLCKYYPGDGSLEELADVVMPVAAAA